MRSAVESENATNEEGDGRGCPDGDVWAAWVPAAKNSANQLPGTTSTLHVDLQCCPGYSPPWIADVPPYVDCHSRGNHEAMCRIRGINRDVATPWPGARSNLDSTIAILRDQIQPPVMMVQHLSYSHYLYTLLHFLRPRGVRLGRGVSTPPRL